MSSSPPTRPPIGEMAAIAVRAKVKRTLSAVQCAGSTTLCRRRRPRRRLHFRQHHSRNCRSSHNHWLRSLSTVKRTLRRRLRSRSRTSGRRFIRSKLADARKPPPQRPQPPQRPRPRELTPRAEAEARTLLLCAACHQMDHRKFRRHRRHRHRHHRQRYQ